VNTGTNPKYDKVEMTKNITVTLEAAHTPSQQVMAK
jgi:hypothetical protein